MRAATGTPPIFVPLPRWRPARPFWVTVRRCVVWGPMLGGLPINVFIVPIPLSYLVGAIPALIGGLFYALWRHAPALHPPGACERMLFGALCGVAGLLACSGAQGVFPLDDASPLPAFLSFNAALGGAATAWIEPVDHGSAGRAHFKRRI